MAQRVQAVERALALLESLADAIVPPTIPELAKAAGVNRATAWRLINTLVHFDLAERDELSGRYKVGPGAMRLAAATNSSTLIRRARPTLERVAEKTGGNTFLEIATRGELVVLDHCRSKNPIQVDLAGMQVAHHAGSVGKLYLGTLPKDELASALSGTLQKFTRYTITDKKKLMGEIALAHSSGVAINYKEHNEDWCGISASIKDQAGRSLAFINVTLPTFNISENQLRGLQPILLEAAYELSGHFTSSSR